MQESSSTAVVLKVGSPAQQQHLGNADPQDPIPSQLYQELWGWGPPVFFNKPSRCMLKFEKHCSGEIFSKGWKASLRGLGKQTSENTREVLEAEKRGSYFLLGDDTGITTARSEIFVLSPQPLKRKPG